MSAGLTIDSVEVPLRFVVSNADAREIASSITEWAAADATVRVVRGRKMRTKQALFSEFAAALQFPWYFGENWDAFDECLSEMDWLPARAGYVIVITDPGQVLLDAEDWELATLIDVLRYAAESYGEPVEQGEPFDRSAVPFHVILAAGPDSTQVRDRWRSAGADLIAAGTSSSADPA
jgi:RNAse (barnase) inhibitor barstar